MLIADPSNHWIWSENATNLAVMGVTWVLADALSTRGQPLSYSPMR
jgi:hypothetical protein